MEEVDRVNAETTKPEKGIGLPNIQILAKAFRTMPRFALGTLQATHMRILLNNIRGRTSGNHIGALLRAYKGGFHNLLDEQCTAMFDWINRSQEMNVRGGLSCYEFGTGWTGTFPEVTGYTIPTYWRAYQTHGMEAIREKAVKMSEWLLTVQFPEGGIQRGYAANSSDPIIFDTGQALRGFLASYLNTEDPRFLKASQRAADWIVAHQSDDGAWRHAVYLGMTRVYDTYVAVPLYELGELLGDDRYRVAALLNCEWALGQQQSNGWFANCDNTIENNERPLTHTIAYTVDGLLEMSLLASREDLWKVGVLTAHKLQSLLHEHDAFYGRWDSEWNPGAWYVCLTGLAQTGIVLLRVYRRTQEVRYLASALQALSFLVHVNDMNLVGDYANSGIAGSFPLWGLYAPLKFPSWAAKFYLDLLLDMQSLHLDTESINQALGRSNEGWTG